MVRRILFPTLVKNKKNVYLDNASTTLKTFSVIKSVIRYYKEFSLNTHSFSDNYLYEEMKREVESARSIIASWINCQVDEIIFTPSTTYALNFLSLSFSSILSSDSKVLTTKTEHNSNLYPWINICIEKGANLNYLELNENFSIDISKLSSIIDNNVKIVTFAHISNNVGAFNDVERISLIIKEKNPNCLIFVDVCQSIAHELIDIKKWKIDALVFSAHKIYGPTGLGVLWMRSGLKFKDILWGGGKELSPLNQQVKLGDKISEKMEVGTLPLSQIFAIRQVFIFLLKIDFKKQKKKELLLRKYAVKRLKEINEVIIYNLNTQTSILLFNLKNFHSHDVANFLSRNNIFIRSGGFCTHYLKDLIGISSAIRISFAIYNRKKDIDILVDHLKKISISKII